MEVEAQQSQQTPNPVVGKSKANKKKSKPKSRNNFDDVQRIEMVNGHVQTIPTTMDIMKTCTDMDDLSKKLEDRLSLNKRNGMQKENELESDSLASPPAVHLVNGDSHKQNEEEEEGKALVENTDSSKPNQLIEICSDNNQNIIYCEPQNKVVYVEEEKDDSATSLNTTTSQQEVPRTEKDEEMEIDAEPEVKIEYKEYESELQMPDIIRLIQKDLSEPYSIYTYRYFIHNWPKLCFLAMHGDKCVGAIVCKLGLHRQIMKRGYIAMLAVDKDYRKLKIGTNLVQKAIEAMLREQADEVVLETEITNTPALRLYENLGFVRDKRLFHYYLNGVDALRLKLWFR